MRHIVPMNEWVSKDTCKLDQRIIDIIGFPLTPALIEFYNYIASRATITANWRSGLGQHKKQGNIDVYYTKIINEKFGNLPKVMSPEQFETYKEKTNSTLYYRGVKHTKHIDSLLYQYKGFNGAILDWKGVWMTTNIEYAQIYSRDNNIVELLLSNTANIADGSVVRAMKEKIYIALEKLDGEMEDINTIESKLVAYQAREASRLLLPSIVGALNGYDGVRFTEVKSEVVVMFNKSKLIAKAVSAPIPVAVAEPQQAELQEEASNNVDLGGIAGTNAMGLSNCKTTGSPNSKTVTKPSDAGYLRPVLRLHKYFKGFADGIPYYDGYDTTGNKLTPKGKKKNRTTTRLKK